MTESEAKHILETDSCYECRYGVLQGASECGNKDCPVAKATMLATNALERQIEINNMALIQSHRKCVLGRDEMYSDSTLQSMSKAELINLLHVAQHNYSVLLEAYDRRMKAYEKELAAMSDEIKFEEE